MKSLFSPSRVGAIEPLEARVAPAAVIYIGYPNDGTIQPALDTHYDTSAAVVAGRQTPFNTLYFHPTFGMPNDPIAAAVNPTGATDTYYLLLRAGDQVHGYSAADGFNNSLLTVNAGNAVAFFTDLNHDGRFQPNELTGIALGKNAFISVGGIVNGDIVSALNDTITASNRTFTIDTSHLVSNQQGIGFINDLAGSVNGNVLSGGNIYNLSIAGNAHNVLTGTAANGAPFDFFKETPDPLHQGQYIERYTVNFAQPAGQAGPYIFNTVVGSLGMTTSTGYVPGAIHAGDGGSGAYGGSLANIWVKSDANAVTLQAGSGGDAGQGFVNGGTGGLLYNIYVGGVSETYNSKLPQTDTNAPSNALVTIQGGHGGNATASGVGGAGGYLARIFVGYDLTTPNGILGAGQPTESAGLSSSNVIIQGGAGGSGLFGGAGGGVSVGLVRVNTPADGGTDLQLLGGTGGGDTASFHTTLLGGVGGSISNIVVNNAQTAPGTTLVVHAGDGGVVGSTGYGAAGGNVVSATLTDYDISLFAGSGSDGKIGGAGGNVVYVTLLQGVGVYNQNSVIDAGHGGVGTAGNGGAGGLVYAVSVQAADFASFEINSGTGGNGGASTGGIGGSGGLVASVAIKDVDVTPGDPTVTQVGSLTVRAGDGGDGSFGGGAGGAVGGGNFPQLIISGSGLNMQVKGGHGGNAIISGYGGSGGLIAKTSLAASDNFQLTNQTSHVTASLHAGDGGNGAGLGAGGAGGAVAISSADARGDFFTNLSGSTLPGGDVTVVAGHGGSGQAPTSSLHGTAPGAGGSVYYSGAFSQFGAGSIIGGDAGNSGAGAANGGSLIGAASALIALRASTDLTIQAGNGSGGGSGGDIVNATYGSPAVGFVPSPTGNIVVQAGQGSGGTPGAVIAGRGGWIVALTGAVTSGNGKSTLIQAGNGGASAGASGAGGWLYNIQVTGGGATLPLNSPPSPAAPAVLRLSAGDAGNAPNASYGAAGGNAQLISIGGLAPDTIVQSIAAGNGGIANPTNGVGGAGGSILGVSVSHHEIGQRTGALFGYNNAGGLFAGAAGAAKFNGVSGNVEYVNADAIASIVAGRTATPQLAQNVDHIYLNDNTHILTSVDLAQPQSYLVSFGGNSVPIPMGATKQQVQNLLNTLPAIQTAGGVTVGYSSTPGSYVVVFKNTGARTALYVGQPETETVTSSAIETIQGSSAAGQASETVMGTQSGNLAIAQQGEIPLTVTVPTHGQEPFVANETVQGDPIAGTKAIQTVDVIDIQKYPNATFTLTFGPDVTGNISANASVTAIAAQLNALPSVMNAGGVTVTLNNEGLIAITFNQPGLEPQISGQKYLPETQQFNEGTFAGNVNAGIKFSFTTQTFQTETVTVPANSSAQQIQSALNSQIQGIQAAGNVTVTAASTPGTFNIQFGNTGEQPVLTAAGEQTDVQTLDLSKIYTAGNGSTFTLAYANNTQTAALAVNATASQIASALNALPSVQSSGPNGVGGAVTVTPTSNPEIFAIAFNTIGPKSAISEIANVPEVQTLDISGVDAKTTPTAGTGRFTLSFNGSAMTQVINPNDGSTPTAIAAKIQAELNNLAEIHATKAGNTGAVMVTPGPTDQYVIQFNSPGEEPLIQENQQILEQQQIEVFAKPSGAQAGAGDFTLTFTDSTNNTTTTATIAVPANAHIASAQQVADALNAIPSIMNEGGVTVTTPGLAGYNQALYTITFNTAAQAENAIKSAQTEPLQFQTLQTGSPTLPEIIKISPTPRGAFDPGKFAAAQLVGSIYDIHAIDGNTFHFTSPANNGTFAVGDTPLDGIVMAHHFDQKTVNFTPEAKLTDAGFFDNTNVL